MANANSRSLETKNAFEEKLTAFLELERQARRA
jgi:hypothetical protein